MVQPTDSPLSEYRSEAVADYILGLLGDPFAHVYRASHDHREQHGGECGVYPSSPLNMRIISVLVRACGARRVLDIGGGLGYSALWLAEAVGPQGQVDTIDRFAEHVRLAKENIAAAGFSERVRVHQGDSKDVLPQLRGSYDLIYDDGWIMREPPHFEATLNLMRPGSLLAMANWFPLEQAVLGQKDVPWGNIFGADWAESILAYAQKLATHPKLRLAYSIQPWLALAVKTE